MFREDISNAVIPYSLNRDGGPRFAATLTGDEAEQQLARTLLTSVSERGQRDDEELIVEVIRRLAQGLAWDGECCFEIIRSTVGRTVALSQFPRSSAFNLSFAIIQIANGDETCQERGVRKQWIWLKNSSLWLLGMPPELGGVRGFRRLLRHLDRCSEFAPKFWVDSPGDSGSPASAAPFDPLLLHRMQHIARGVATKQWGWHQRNFELRDITEYYHFYLQLRFARAMSHLRHHIVQELNQLLVRLKIVASIKVEGLDSPRAIEIAIEQMSAGQIDFSAAARVARQCE